MSIENQLQVIADNTVTQIQLLEVLISKFDHIGTGVSDLVTSVDSLENGVQGAAAAKSEASPLEEVAKASTSKRKRRTKAEIAADNAAEAAAAAQDEPEAAEEAADTTPEVKVAEKTGELPPEPKEVKDVQEFKKELIGIGRASGQASYVQTLKGVLKAAGYDKAEAVDEDDFDAVLASATEAFADDEI